MDYIMRLHKTYGPVVSVPIGVQEFVFIKDGELISELYQKEEFASRPIETLPVFKQIAHGTPRGTQY